MSTALSIAPSDPAAVVHPSTGPALLALLLQVAPEALDRLGNAALSAADLMRLLAHAAPTAQLHAWRPPGPGQPAGVTGAPAGLVGPLPLAAGTCLVLTAAHLEEVRRLGAGASLPTPTPSQVPHWDGRRLRWGRLVLREFRQPAPNQRLVMEAFQEQGWVQEIDDPLPPKPWVDAKLRLHDTICSLNRYLRPRLLRFRGNGTGQAIRWEYVGHQVTTAAS